MRPIRLLVLFCAAWCVAPSLATAAEKTAKRSPLELQVALDRLRFSPGPVDGKVGMNTRKALRALQRSRGFNETGRADEKVWQVLDAVLGDPVLIKYEITPQDVSGPFTPSIPDSLEEQAQLERLGYTSAEELLAEKFHMDIDFLKRLNQGKRFDEPGSVIKVANVVRKDPPNAARLRVDKAMEGVLALDPDGQISAFFPATIGSDETPSPSGTVSVTRIAENPTYTYDPAKLNFKGVKANQKLEIKPGPNNPVGLVWIALSEPGYGIHGSPEPSAISRQASHGCVRLTNWDALDLAKMVRKGVEVEFVETSQSRR
jgi:lipoprotein-anchoring transpeptidase ErfK/SrfK